MHTMPGVLRIYCQQLDTSLYQAFLSVQSFMNIILPIVRYQVSLVLMSVHVV